MNTLGSNAVRGALAGAVAGAVGTAAMDALWYFRFRRGGGKTGFVDWETSAGVKGWDDAPVPAKVGRLVLEHTVHRDLPPQRARIANNVVHWLTGTGSGAVFGVLEIAVVRRKIWHGPLFGLAVWIQSYAVLGTAKLYKPIWEYDGPTLAKDLSAHLVYGTTTAAALTWLLRRR